ncbi:MAG: NADP-dependent phosphogluconate dehydrogenase [Chitinophagaceae bacterium]|nr:MAG: NADP-dependent phosphogluconate dehydrogenase [Chitinophagaceae bacterium]
MTNQLFDFGMIGLGVMGQNFLYNLADHNFKVIGFDKDTKKTSALEQGATPGTHVKGVNSLEEMVASLAKPRRLMLLVPAGKPVDDVIESLKPLVEPGDIIIDGGNSHYTDTLRRVNYLNETGIHFMGMGVSGGEQGARRGPSIMPGGNEVAWQTVKPVLEAVAAKVHDVPCVAYLGKGAAGHFVKMVHNGIEYAIMQLISEAYDILRRGVGLTNPELHEVFKTWNESELESFLIEITSEIFKQKDDKTDGYLIDQILDKAGSKGTGKWTSQDALNLPVPIPTIDMAVTMRNISSFKTERLTAAELYPSAVKPIPLPKEVFIKEVKNALAFSIVISYAQGLAMLQKASSELDMQIPLPEVVKVWRGGCIIRSILLDMFSAAFAKDAKLSNILLDKGVSEWLLARESDLRKVSALIVHAGYPAGSLLSSLSYFDAYRSGTMPTNLIQAQRDFFGAHTYQRIDSGDKFFHTEWDEKKPEDIR